MHMEKQVTGIVGDSTLRGFYNVRINGDKLGRIVWDEKTGRIVGIYYHDQLIEAVLQELPAGVGWMDGMGFEAYPAGIDMHVHDRPDQPAKEDVRHLEAACFAGGIGTIATMPNSVTPFTHPDQLEGLIRRWQNSLLTTLFNIGVSKDNFSTIAHLDRYPSERWGHVKEYDAETTNPALSIIDLALQRRAAESIGTSGRVRLVHAESQEVLDRARLRIQQERNPKLSDHCAIRSPLAEIVGIEQALQVCREVGVRTHFCHVSTKRGVELIDNARQAGLSVTAETSPHYFVLHDEDYTRLLGRGKMNPALRSPLEMEAVLDYLCRGRIDIIATDHAPHEIKAKDQTAYDLCPSGVPGVQTMMLLAYELKATGRITAKRFVDLTSKNAAELLGLNKGLLEPGRDADIVLIRPKLSTLFSDESMKYKCPWTPFAGRRVSASIGPLVLGGKLVKK